MELKTGLFSLWVCIMFLAMPCRSTQGCDLPKRIMLTKCIMEELRCSYLNSNSGNITCWPHPISELDLKTLVSTEDKIQKGVCGFSYIRNALDLIYSHQRDLHSNNKDIFHQINMTNNELLLSENCVEGVLKVQCRNKTKPDFNHKETYKQLQWGRTVIESSIVFMKQFVETVVKRRHETNYNLKSLIEHKPCYHKCSWKNKNAPLCFQDRH